MIRMIDQSGYRGDWSFEVFNDDYVQMPVRRWLHVRVTPRCGWRRSTRRSLPRTDSSVTKLLVIMKRRQPP